MTLLAAAGAGLMLGVLIGLIARRRRIHVSLDVNGADHGPRDG